MNDNFEAAFKQLVEAVGQAQAYNRNSYILMEVVRDLARSQANPQKYLADMFERISARADQGPIEKEARPVNFEFRDAISRFFSNAGHKLAR